MKIAVVEDDINMRKSLEFALEEYKEFEVITYKSAKEALRKIDDSFDLIITDITMPGIDGIEFVKRLDGRFDIIVITGNATLNRAIEALRLGVKDFLTKPFEIETLVKAIKRSKIIKEIKAAKKPKSSDEKKVFLGVSSVLEKALNLAKKAAVTDASVLLLGESGVGKELFARYIHDNSKRSKAPFIAINMAAIPENLLESELFGYEKGAFTDALAQKKGQFEAAQGGTLFLDEIAEMPVALQAKLLRVLQEREFVRVGGTQPVKIDVRIISATNADILKKVKDKEFREDLYYRLNTIPIKIPTLRERKDEIMQIANSSLENICEKYGFEKKRFSNKAKESLLRYEWPGNIRELISVVERAAILSEGNEISEEDLFLESRSFQKNIKNMEKELITEVLESVGYDHKEAAQILSISESVLQKKIENYNIRKV
jgi:DNA-binding NtrC family response regulator